MFHRAIGSYCSTHNAHMFRFFTDGELVEFLYDVFQLLFFLGVVKGHPIKILQSFRLDTVKEKGNLMGLRLLVDIHYNCIITLCLLEGFPVFCNLLFNVEMTRRVNSLNWECYRCGARLAPCKVIQGSFGFRIPRCGFRIPCMWIPDSICLFFLSSIKYNS